MTTIRPNQPTLSPKTVQAPNKAQRFGGTGLAAVIGPDAIQSFLVDTAGVYAPKLPVLRSKTQFFEETYLELVEDAAFYFSVPLFGRFVAAPFFKKHFGVDKLHHGEVADYLRHTALPNAGVPQAHWKAAEQTLSLVKPKLKDDHALVRHIVHEREKIALTGVQRSALSRETKLLESLKAFKADDLQGKLAFVLKEAHGHDSSEANEAIRKGAMALYKETPHIDAIGTSLRHWAGKGAPNQKILAAKLGVIISSLAFAGAFEYMIQHTKNVITAKKFHTNNFTAVAGLEKARLKLKNGEADPVAKAKRRGWQVAGLLGAAFAASLTVPRLIFNSSHNASKAFSFLKQFDFSHRSAFGLSRVFLAALVGTGVVSYLDAARDNLEFKETGTRLIGVAPYLIFAKALSNNWLAKRLGNRNVTVNGETKTVKDLVPFLEDKAHHLTDSKLDLGLTKGYLDSGKDNKAAFLKAIEKNGPLPKAVRDFLLNQRQIHIVGSYALGAGVLGTGLLSLAYWQTKARYNKMTAAEKAELARQEQAERIQQQEKKRKDSFFYAPGYAPAAFGTNPFGAAAPYATGYRAY